MRSETEMVTYALEVDSSLLPWIPELLADFGELGSDADFIVDVLRALELPASSRVVDLGCGKGAIAVAIARQLGWRVEGYELFEPFVESCRKRAAAAGVANLCRFHHGDIQKLAGRTEPADVAIFAALGDVLGPLEHTVGVIRRFVRRGGHIVICDCYIKEGGTSAFPGFEDYGSRESVRQRLQAHGDALQREVIAPADDSEAYAREMGQIRRRAEGLIARHPELKGEVMHYVENQQQTYDYMAANVVPVTWVLQRSARGSAVPEGA